ncbi:MAG TPA: DUF58 domain-containing protein [Planctomycetaceae bacterium]|nr:DUF58 domain-containing protein [Planctomycetaceae bacterium]
MPDSRRFLHPEAIRRIARMDLRARHIVEGLLSGMHRSPYFGQSIEFRQHREYVAGDDLRHVDWKVWARQDRLYVKQFEEDTNLRCLMLVDVSASMRYGDGPLSKYDYACTVAASLAYWVLRQQDSIGLMAFDRTVRARLPVRSRRNQLMSIIEALNVAEPSEKTDLFAILQQVAEDHPKRGMVILVSDLLGDVERTLKGLRWLRQRGHDVMVFHIMDDDELDFPFSGPTRFEGLESDDFLNCNPRALRDAYLESLGTFLDRLRRECAKQVVDYALIRTSEPLDAALARYISHRLASMGRR